MVNLFYHLIKIILLLVLPFATLIRGASFLHFHLGYSAFTCLGLAAGATTIIMFVYFSFFYGNITGKFGNFDAVKRRALIAFLMVLIYCMHGLLFFNSSHLKSASLKDEMSNLHPIVRLSLSTLVYLDRDLIITDASRQPEDYRKMGLPTKKSSLHYTQASTNYAHAVDIRTKGRSEFKNGLINLYFRIMGFNTLRHHGTADHLHVSLHSHDAPHSK